MSKSSFSTNGMRAWTHVADLAKPKNLNGALVARSVAGVPFLLFEGLEVAFVPPVLDAPRRGTVVEVRPAGDGAYVVRFDTVSTAEHAHALAGCSCLARRADLPEDIEEDAPGLLLGYVVVDGACGEIGTVADVIENPGQWLLSVEGPHGEVLVPFVEPIVCGIDDAARVVEVDLPAGLLELSGSSAGKGGAR